MAGSFAERAVAQPVQLHDRAGGAVLDGKLERVRLFVSDAGERALVVVVWFDYWTYQRIDRAHLFGYTFESIDREGLQSWELVSSKPVQLELRAEPAALAALGDGDAEAVVERAVAALADPASPLVDAASYRYLAVYQEKEMAGATYLSGFTSIYKRG